MGGWFRESPRSFAIAVSLAYLAIGLMWIGFSDEVGAILFASTGGFKRFQTYKGTAFVASTALLIFLLLDRRRAKPPATGAAFPAGAPLGLLLSGLVLACAAPLIALMGYNIARDTRLALQDANSLVRGVAADTASDVDALLASHQRMVGLLNRQPLPEAGDLAACRRFLLFVSGLQDHLRSVLLLDADGQRSCAVGDTALATYVPPGVLARADTPILSQPARANGGWTFTITYPLHGEGTPVRAIQMVVSSAALERLLVAPLPAGSATTLVDAQGFILARSPDAGMVGTRLRDSALFERMRRGQTTLVQARDGVERVYAVRPASHLGLYTVAGVASEQVYGPVRESAARSALVGLAVLLLAGVVVLRISRKVTAPMAALARTAERVASGELDQRAPEGGPSEIARVAAQFNRMLDRLPVLERQLRESEARHRTLLEKLSLNIPGMIFQLRLAPDGSATLPFASHGIHRMFEVSPQQARHAAAALRDRIHPDDAQRVAAATAESARALSHFSVDYRVVLPLGGVRFYLTHSQPERQDDGSVLWHGCTVDVTELELAQQELKRLNSELEARVRERTGELAAANEALESFSYSVAHDLRAPLDAIAGFASALAPALRRGDTARVEHLCERIAANAHRMTGMVAGLLALAKAGQGRPADSPQDLHAMARAVLADLQLPPGMELRVAPLPVASVDAATMRQVLWNLLSNAAKFAAGRAPACIEVGWQRAEAEAVFFVRDNGVGFDPEHAARLFSAFHRLHPHADYEGTGIGLAIVKRVVEWHGGRAWADSSPGAGATFYFSLPLRRVVE
ncbi:MAG: ATP-binding protein [Pseudomonadota bacterium]